MRVGEIGKEKYDAVLKREEIDTIFFSLLAYRDQLVDDLATHGNGREHFGLEDQVFLGRTIAEVTKLALYIASKQELDHSDSVGDRYKKLTREELIASLDERSRPLEAFGGMTPSEVMANVAVDPIGTAQMLSQAQVNALLVDDDYDDDDSCSCGEN
jgi:hypothetical protein